MITSKFLNPKNHVAFRKIFGTEKHKDILIHFINDMLCLEGPYMIKEVTFLSTVQDPEIACKKESIVDVLCKDNYDREIIVEMQVTSQEGFEKRAQYYASKAYSRQLNVGQEVGARYQDLKAVIFIAITDYIVFPSKTDYFSNHIVLDAKTYTHDLQDFSFTFIELPKFKIKSIGALSTMIEKWCYFFKYASSTSEADVKKIIDPDLVIQRAYEALNRFNWSEIELRTYEKEIKRIMDNQAVEDYMKKQARQAGEEVGLKQGLKQGLEQGLKQGKLEGRLEGEKEKALSIAKAMYLKGYLLEDIMLLTGLSKGNIEKSKC